MIEKQLSRRDFLNTSVALGLAVLEKNRAGSAQASSDGLPRLTQEVNSLPPSLIKDYLQEGLSIFTQPTPSLIKLADMDFKLKGSSVVSNSLDNTFSGTITAATNTLRPRALVSNEAYYPLSNITLRIPYLGLVLESEKSKIPSFAKASDGTALIDVEFPSDTPLFEGIWPEIEVNTPTPNHPRFSEFDPAMESFAYVKELGSNVLVLTWIEEVIKKMRLLCLSTNIPSKTKDKKESLPEAVIQAVGSINDSGGRMLASFDIAGYLIGFKAFEGTEVNERLRVLPEVDRAITSSLKLDLGKDKKSMLLNSLSWALTEPAAKELFHSGRLERIAWSLTSIFA